MTWARLVENTFLKRKNCPTIHNSGSALLVYTIVDNTTFLNLNRKKMAASRR